MHNLLKSVRREAEYGVNDRLNPYTAAALSVMPGLGQLYNGQKAKAFLFMDVAFVNFVLLGTVLLAQPLSRALLAISAEFHARANADLIKTLQHVSPGSTVSNIVLLLVLSFAIYAARDAYDTARVRKFKAIYSDAIIGMAEAASGSYLMHLALMFTCAILALFLIMPTPPRQQITDIEFVPPSLVPKVPTRDTNKISTVPSNGIPKPTTPRERSASSSSSSKHSPKTSSSTQPTSSSSPAVNRPTQLSVSQSAQSAAAAKPATPLQIKPLLMPRQAVALPQPLKGSSKSNDQPVAPHPQSQVLLAAAPPSPIRPSLSKLSEQPSPSAKSLERLSTAITAPAPSLLPHHESGSAQPLPVAAGSPSKMSVAPTPESAPASTSMARAGSSDGVGPMPSKADPKVAWGGPTVMPNVGPGIGHTGPPANWARNNVNPRGLSDDPRPGIGHHPGSTPDIRSGKGINDTPTIKEIDFSLYMANLQRRIKSHWIPPKYTLSNRVRVNFKISQSGEMSDLVLDRSSGIKIVDEAALESVRYSAPFPHLPEGASSSGDASDGKVQIQFTFDYNVFDGGTGRVVKF